MMNNEPLVFAAGFIFGGLFTAVFITEQFQEPAVIQEVITQEITIDYMFERCSTLKQEPDFTYHVEHQTVTFVIECRPEVMFPFMEAVE